jgi:predicted lysophospholipase L1 biosynthesis ABC-type transport system permease subunit
VALGSRTAAEHDVGVGDQVEVEGGGFSSRSATVTGLVVLPPLGSYEADRASPGTGMLLPEAAAPGPFLEQDVAFVGIDLVDGTDPHRIAAEMHDVFAGWDVNGWMIVDYDRPVRPAEIVDADRMRSVPLLAGALLVAAAVLGLTLAVVLSVRSRRRELATLRALGFTGRQLRDSVRVQALVTMATALVVGVPAGVVLGRLAWRAFAAQLGVAAGPVVPAGWIVVTVVGGLVVALVAAAVPARVASRIDPAAVLRSE